jgi:hypothetical protein
LIEALERLPVHPLEIDQLLRMMNPSTPARMRELADTLERRRRRTQHRR